jgi:NAD(P)-dependent dehydrogenase (short-subunit alcohol dehydrogenase family)
MWDRIVELDATSPFRVTRALVPAMIAAGWGRVVNIASNAGVSGYGYTAAYCAAKHAMVGFTRALAIDLAKTGVTINALCPGWVDTDLATEAVQRIADKTGRSFEDAKKTLENMSPQRRLIQPAEVAHAAVMLCADAARGIHGQTLVIDGGAILK